MQGYQGRLFLKELSSLQVIRMGMGAYDQADVVECQP